MKHIKGSIIDHAEGINFIIHQANCQCTMGSGVAASLRAKWPKVYEADCNAARIKKNILGEFSFAKVEETPPLYVINIYGQDYYGESKRHTDYNAIVASLEKLNILLTNYEKTVANRPVIGVPMKMGCDRAGGNWDIYLKIIQVCLSPHEIVVVEWDGS